MESLLEINKKLDLLGYCLKPFCKENEHALYEIFRDVVDSGSQFPYECSSFAEFQKHFFSLQSKVYVCLSSSGEVIGGFYIKSNYTGRSSHIANAAYMIKDTYRGKGIGSLIVKASLHLAKELGFKAMQFNMVLSENSVATKLYQKLGFETIGTIPNAIRKPDESYQAGYIMHRSLDDI